MGFKEFLKTATQKTKEFGNAALEKTGAGVQKTTNIKSYEAFETIRNLKRLVVIFLEEDKKKEEGKLSEKILKSLPIALTKAWTQMVTIKSIYFKKEEPVAKTLGVESAPTVVLCSNGDIIHSEGNFEKIQNFLGVMNFDDYIKMVQNEERKEAEETYGDHDEKEHENTKADKLSE